MEKEILYTAKEASELLSVSHQTIKRWHRNGKIKSIQVGNGWIRVPESEIKRILGD